MWEKGAGQVPTLSLHQKDLRLRGGQEVQDAGSLGMGPLLSWVVGLLWRTHWLPSIHSPLQLLLSEVMPLASWDISKTVTPWTPALHSTSTSFPNRQRNLWTICLWLKLFFLLETPTSDNQPSKDFNSCTATGIMTRLSANPPPSPQGFRGCFLTEDGGWGGQGNRNVAPRELGQDLTLTHSHRT